MGTQKRDANGKIIPGPSDLKPQPNRNRPGRRNGSEKKRAKAHYEEVDVLVEQSRVELRWCSHCRVMKCFDSFPEAASTSIKLRTGPAQTVSLGSWPQRYCPASVGLVSWPLHTWLLSLPTSRNPLDCLLTCSPKLRLDRFY